VPPEVFADFASDTARRFSKARQQSVVFIRLRMNREVHMLSSQLVRSSGYAALDQAAKNSRRLS
jgi:outer membrane biosynthesis protein TonB